MEFNVVGGILNAIYSRTFISNVSYCIGRLIEGSNDNTV